MDNPRGDSHQAPHAMSRFTHRDLRLMGRSSPKSPLRVIALIDFDAFYAQCETVRLDLAPEEPLAVQQWNAIIALNYAAREYGLKRGVSVDEAKLRCPHLRLQHVATWREGDTDWAYRPDVVQHMRTDKAALEPYRMESRKALDLVVRSLPQTSKVEKASIDEMFVDLSSQVHTVLIERYPCLSMPMQDSDDDSLPPPPSDELEWEGDHVLGDHPLRLDWDDVTFSLAAGIVRGLRSIILDTLRYTTSAGIGPNKTVAKLGAGYRKPNQQTVITSYAAPDFLSSLKYRKIRGLGRQLGEKVEAHFHGTTVADLLPVPLKEMQSKLGSETGLWLHNVVRGSEYSEVTARVQIQTMLSQKTFLPSVDGLQQASKWLRIFAAELYERVLELDTPTVRRRPRTLAVNHHINGRFGLTRSQQTLIPGGAIFSADLLCTIAYDKLRDITSEEPSWPCAALGVSLSNFMELETQSASIKSFFSPQSEDSLARSHQGSIKRRLSDVLPDSGMKKRFMEVSQPIETDSKAEHSHAADEPDVPTDTYLCPSCSKIIAALEVLEHLDWHVAIELQAKG
ncbi:N-acetyltransferase eso1 [Elasticomyces elasticus]|nr:N-acetyltransferase eso1 [Elasticomyces elasticus]KAK4971103.1 N-acetyltransferase eso1 [Elasticomyces elasticus]